MPAVRIDAASVKAFVSPVDFYRLELPGMPSSRRGRAWVSGGLCPFHEDHHASNFRVNLETGAFTCFACGAKGADIIAFVQLRRGLSFQDALAEIASAWGIRQ